MAPTMALLLLHVAVTSALTNRPVLKALRGGGESIGIEQPLANHHDATLSSSSTATVEFDELKLVALLATIGAVACFWHAPASIGREVARRHMVVGGLLVMASDFFVEYFGTRQGASGGWHYNKSLWFVTGTVPIELVVLFFACGVWMATIHLLLRSGALPLPPALAVGGLLLCLAVWPGTQRNLFLQLPFALWGFCQLGTAPHVRAGAIALATATAVADWLVESWAIKGGNYAYAYDFSIDIPLMYGMLVLGFLGILEAAIPLID